MGPDQFYNKYALKQKCITFILWRLHCDTEYHETEFYFESKMWAKPISAQSDLGQKLVLWI